MHSSHFSSPSHSYANILSHILLHTHSWGPTHLHIFTRTSSSSSLPPSLPPPPPSSLPLPFSLLLSPSSSSSLPCPSQESGTSCSVESEHVWLCSCHNNLSAVVSHLTPGQGRGGGRRERKEGEERGSHKIQQGFSSPLPSAASLVPLLSSSLPYLLALFNIT